MALEALRRSGRRLKEVAAKIARDHPALAGLTDAEARRSSGLQTTILGWRKQLSGGRVKNFEGQELYSAGLQKMEGLSGTQLAAFAQTQVAEALAFRVS